MVEVTGIEGALLAFIGTAAAHECELCWFRWVGENWSWMGEFHVLFADNFEDLFACKGLGTWGRMGCVSGGRTGRGVVEGGCIAIVIGNGGGCCLALARWLVGEVSNRSAALAFFCFLRELLGLEKLIGQGYEVIMPG